MNGFLEFILFVSVGAAIGLIYWMGLWWTVKVQMSQRSVAIYLISFLARISLAILVLYFVLQSGIVNLVAAVIGIMMIRSIFIRRLGLPRSQTKSEKSSKLGLN